MVFTLKEPVIFNMVTLTNESNIKVDLSIAVYSHSEYYDLWEPFFSRLKKYHSECKIYFFVDKVINDFQKKYKFATKCDGYIFNVSSNVFLNSFSFA
jgi:hypothetical protein